MERLCGMMVSTARNHFTANRSMAITTMLHEQRHMVPYIHFDTDHDKPTADGDNDELDELLDEDGDGGILLHRFFCRLLKFDPDSPRKDKETEGGVKFGGVKQTSRFTAYESRLLNDFIRRTNTAESNAVAHHPDMPKDFVRWKTCTFNDHDPLAVFQVVSDELAATNSTRCASVVRYVDPNLNVGTDSNFGCVRFFLTVKLPSRKKLQKMAYIRRFSVVKDGRLAYTTDPWNGKCMMIKAGWIQELCGLITKDSRAYITRQTTLLLS